MRENPLNVTDAAAIPLSSRARWMALAAWAAFCAFLVQGFPPPVDLPAHGAQLQTLVSLLRNDAEVAQHYALQFPLGYGLDYWLFLPLAWLTSGAFAIRAALLFTLLLYPVALWSLLRVFRRAEWLVLLGLPLTFNISYWYGLTSGLFAQPLAIFALAAFVRMLEAPSRRRVVLVNALALATMMAHLVAFAALGVALLAYALSAPKRRTRLLLLAASVTAPVVFAVPKILTMASRAVTPGGYVPTEYNAAAHLNWFFKNYAPEGLLAAALPAFVTAVFAVLYLARRKREPAGPAAIFFALCLLYVLTPKNLSGIYLIHARLPVLAAVAALPLLDARALPRLLRMGLVALSLCSLAETAAFHVRFKREVAGLEAFTEGARPPLHAYWSSRGRTVLNSKQIYLEHLGQWRTAALGGVGHNFFADAEHHPVCFSPGPGLPADVALAGPRWEPFQEVLIFGDGQPPAGSGFREVTASGSWRLFRR